MKLTKKQITDRLAAATLTSGNWADAPFCTNKLSNIRAVCAVGAVVLPEMQGAGLLTDFNRRCTVACNGHEIISEEGFDEAEKYLRGKEWLAALGNYYEATCGGGGIEYARVQTIAWVEKHFPEEVEVP